jgi:uncharacterized protein YwgA
MEVKDFVTLTFLASGGEIRGKTKLQKTVYFLGLMTGHLDDLGYRAHFYGPYCDEVSDAITTLKTIGAIDQNVTSWGPDRSGFEVCRYDFRLNETGRRFAEAKAKQHPELAAKLRTAAKALKEAGDIDYMEMSIAAKTYFILGERKKPASKSELAQLASRFGWKVSPDQVQRAAEYLGRLGLVELAGR